MSLLRDQHVRSLLWTFSALAPIIALVLLALCCWRPTRRPALAILALSIIAAAVATTWFHFAHVVPIWSGHASAIWLLDRGAFTSAFATVACGAGIACLVYRICQRQSGG